MHCVKLLGQSLMARDFYARVAELQDPNGLLNLGVAREYLSQTPPVEDRSPSG